MGCQGSKDGASQDSQAAPTKAYPIVIALRKELEEVKAERDRALKDCRNAQATTSPLLPSQHSFSLVQISAQRALAQLDLQSQRVQQLKAVQSQKQPPPPEYPTEVDPTEIVVDISMVDDESPKHAAPGDCALDQVLCRNRLNPKLSALQEFAMQLQQEFDDEEHAGAGQRRHSERALCCGVYLRRICCGRNACSPSCFPQEQMEGQYCHGYGCVFQRVLMK